jgi:hypothetical protein
VQGNLHRVPLIAGRLLEVDSVFENLTLQVFFWGVLGIGVGAAVRFGTRRRDYAVVVKLGY